MANRKFGLIKIANGLDLNDSINMLSAGGQSPKQEMNDSIDKAKTLILDQTINMDNSRNSNL